MAETPDTSSTMMTGVEKREDVEVVSTFIGTQIYRNVSSPTPSPNQDSLKLTKSRKIAIATFLIMCNSVLVCFPSLS